MITFTGFAASQTCGIVHPRLSNSLRTKDGSSRNANAGSLTVCLSAFSKIKRDLLRTGLVSRIARAVAVIITVVFLVNESTSVGRNAKRDS